MVLTRCTVGLNLIMIFNMHIIAAAYQSQWIFLFFPLKCKPNLQIIPQTKTLKVYFGNFSTANLMVSTKGDTKVTINGSNILITSSIIIKYFAYGNDYII